MRYWETSSMASSKGRKRFRVRKRSAVLIAAFLSAGVFSIFCPGLFDIREIRFVGYTRLPSKSLDLAKEELLGKNLITVSTDSLEHRLLAFPEVKSVRFDRRLFHTLECRIARREPIALLLAGNAIEVDRTGSLMPARDGEGDLDLPVITGLNEREARTEAGRKKLEKAIELLELVKFQSISSKRQVSEIHVDSGYMDVIWTGSGTLVRFGVENCEAQVKKLQAISTLLFDSEQSPALIDLRFERQVIVR